MSDIVKFIRAHEDEIYDLLKSRRILENKLNNINDLIYSKCHHEWYVKNVDNKISFILCKYCELNKR